MSKPKAEIETVLLRDNYSESLLRAMYDQLMVPSFGMFESELEAFETWEELVNPAKRPSGAAEEYALHAIVLLEASAASIKERPKPEDRIAAAVMCEYYPVSNCGLMTYIVVDEKMRKFGLGKILVDETLKALNASAVAAGKPDGCAAIFLETNSDSVDASKDVMIPAERRKVLHKLGFRILNCTYVQPALSAEQEKCTDLLLAVHESFLTNLSDGPAFIGTPVRSLSTVTGEATPPGSPLPPSQEATFAAPSLKENVLRASLSIDDAKGTKLSKSPSGSIASFAPQKGLPAHIILDFMREFFTVLMGEESLRTDSDYLSIQQELCNQLFVTSQD